MSTRTRRRLGAIDQLPSGRWRVRIDDPARSKRVSIGTWEHRREAERALAAATADQDRGAWVAPQDGRLTLAEFAPGWLATRLTTRGEPLRPRVKELYEGYLRLHILPTLGPMPLGRLTTATVRSWYAELLSEGPGRSTVAKCYRLLRAMLNTAVEDRHLVVNPCAIKGAGIEPSEERRIPTVPQVLEIADRIEPRYRALVLLAAFGGLRRGELLGLRRCDVNLLHRTLDVRVQRQQSRTGAALVGPPKTAAGRRSLSLPLELIPELEAHLATWSGPGMEGLVFIGEKGGPVRPGVLQKEWVKARSSVGLDGLHLHDLRHVAGTLAAATGASTKEIMRRLGHATQEAALRYQHATDERDRVLAAGIDRIIQTARHDAASQFIPLRSADGA